jgi:hypothetical protein
MQAWLDALSPGSICSTDLRKERALRLKWPTYFFCNVSGLDMSGNLRPTKRGLRRNNSSCSVVMAPRRR